MNQKNRMGEWSPDVRMLVFEELGDDVDEMLLGMERLPQGQKSQWLAQEAQRIVVPYVAAGANPAIMVFWVGVLVGSKLRKKAKLTEEVEVDLHGKQFG